MLGRQRNLSPLFLIRISLNSQNTRKKIRRTFNKFVPFCRSCVIMYFEVLYPAGGRWECSYTEVKRLWQ